MFRRSVRFDARLGFGIGLRCHEGDADMFDWRLVVYAMYRIARASKARCGVEALNVWVKTCQNARPGSVGSPAPQGRDSVSHSKSRASRSRFEVFDEASSFRRKRPLKDLAVSLAYSH